MLKHKTDINAMGQCMLLDKERDILGSLKVGQAIVKLQGRITRPFQISIPEFKIKKGEITDAFVKQHMNHISPVLGETDFRLSVDPNKKIIESSEHTEIEFLRDVFEYPESGIAARYKRLNLSVRQGQKLKAKLLEKGLIVEDKEFTKTGRLNIICLTEKGRFVLVNLNSDST